MSSLPKIDLPIYNTFLPSTGESINYRPYTVKEMKILLQASNSTDDNDRTMALRQILTNCILNEGFDVNKMRFIDLEMMFIKIRAVSQSNVVLMAYPTEQVPMCTKKCEGQIKFELNLDNVTIKNRDGSDFMYGSLAADEKLVELTPKLFIAVRQPSINEVNILTKIEKGTDVEAINDYLLMVITKVISNDQVTDCTTVSKEDMTEFVDSMEAIHLAKLEKEVFNFPEISCERKIKCQHCNFGRTIKIDKLTDFFV